MNTTLACTTSLVAISSVVLCWFGGSGNEAGAGCVELEVGLAAQSAFLCNFVQSVSGMTVFINVSHHWKGGKSRHFIGYKDHKNLHSWQPSEGTYCWKCRW